MDPATLTPERRAVAAALLFLGSAALGGVHLLEGGVRYHTPGVVEGIFALLLAYILLLQGAWVRPPGWLGWLPVAYGTAASAQLLGLLLPPPGLVQWTVVFVLALTVWGALAGGTRTRLVASLASLALLLALLKFSVIPFLWERAGPGPGEALGFGSLAESVRRFFAEHEPMRPAGQTLGLLALSLWALGSRLLWGPESLPERATGG